MNIRSSFAWGFFVLVAVAAACDRTASEAPEREGPPVVYTTFYPTLYFVQRVAGDGVRAVCPLPDDADPIFWMPAPAAIAAYQAADLVVVNGAGFEKWVAKVSLPTSRVVDTARSFEDEFLRYESAVSHSHGPSGKHSHEGLDGHTWLDPQNAIRQAAVIRDALSARFPDQRPVFAKGYAALEADLRSLDAALKEVTALAGEREKPALLCSHPAYNYIAKRYGWRIANLDLDPDEMPSAAQLVEIVAIKEKLGARYLLWESRPQAEIAARLQRELGLESIVFSPCELLGADERESGVSYLSVMRANIEALRPVFGS